MKTNRFIRENLTDEARITIVDEKGEIWYEGDVMSLPRMITVGTTVKSVTLGEHFDLIITVKA